MAETFWIEKGWLRWGHPSDPLNWLGSPDGNEDGGFSRIRGCGSGLLLLKSHTGRLWRLDYEPENFVETATLKELPRG